MTWKRSARSSAWIAALLLVIGLAAWWRMRGARVASPDPAPPLPVATRPAPSAMPSAPPAIAAPPARDVIDGHVLDAISHDGVAGAELSFVGDAGVSTFETRGDGSFTLAPPATGRFELSTITAPGYMPYTPDLAPAGVHVTLTRGPAVHGVTLMLAPVVAYRGLVVDAHAAPIAGAHVRLIHSPAGELARDDLPSAWTTGADGRFTFQAVEDSVLEAGAGTARGAARIDRGVVAVRSLRIQLAPPPAPATTITGHVRTADGAPVAGARLCAEPAGPIHHLPAVYAASAADGAFTLAGVDRDEYDVTADAADHGRGERRGVHGGSHDLELVVAADRVIAGQVVDDGGAPIAQFTLRARRHDAAADRRIAVTRATVEPEGRFAIRVPAGDYDLEAAARGHAASPPVQASAGATGVRIVIGRGASVRGVVLSAEDHAPLRDAVIARDTFDPDQRRAGADDSVTTTRADGSFLLTGITAGPVTLRITAFQYHAEVRTLTATDGGELGPLAIELDRRQPGELRRRELSGVGIQLLADGDAMRVARVLPDSAAADAGLVVDDRIVAIDGQPVAPLGVDDASRRIRGPAGTTVTLTLRRAGRDLALALERRPL